MHAIAILISGAALFCSCALIGYTLARNRAAIGAALRGEWPTDPDDRA